MKPKIKKEEVIKIKYTIYCPECKRGIVGNSKTMAEYNFEVHMREKHKEVK